MGDSEGTASVLAQWGRAFSGVQGRAFRIGLPSEWHDTQASSQHQWWCAHNLNRESDMQRPSASTASIRTSTRQE
jgi:predicted alpha-1,6-mannanase (GH76 family)